MPLYRHSDSSDYDGILRFGNSIDQRVRERNWSLRRWELETAYPSILSIPFRVGPTPGFISHLQPESIHESLCYNRSHTSPY